VRDGQASVTAQRVAAHRLTFGRVQAPYGDPSADEALARDVAAAAVAEPGPMREYLRARTRFFDGVVTGLRGLVRVSGCHPQPPCTMVGRRTAGHFHSAGRFTGGSFRAGTARCCMTPSGARR